MTKNRGLPISPQLRARIARAIDRGLTYQEFVDLDPQRQLASGQNVTRALRGDPVESRTTRSLTRSCEISERDVARGWTDAEKEAADAEMLAAEGLYRIEPQKPALSNPKKADNHGGMTAVVGLIQAAEHLLMTGSDVGERRNHVLALLYAARVQATI